MCLSLKSMLGDCVEDSIKNLYPNCIKHIKIEHSHEFEVCSRTNRKEV